jgi:pilus assembly protein CpaF
MTSENELSTTSSARADLARLRKYLSSALAQQMEQTPLFQNQPRKILIRWLEQLYDRAGVVLPEAERIQLFKEILDDLLGYGPLQPLLEEADITEIMVYGYRQIYIERGGNLFETGLTFEDDNHVLRIIDRIIRPLGRHVDRDHPMVDARLPDGSRVNIVVPPVAIDGPCITIRKFLRNKLTVNDLIELGSLTRHMAEFLRACVAARLNILISGNTSSGKTTLLNVLSDYIPDDERIITIEDAAELQLKQKFLVRLETRQAGSDGSPEIVTRDLVRNALRMRPDRIVVGEVRTGEALDMLQAMNTGHTGSITTLHANSPRDAISRLETMAMMAGLDMPIMAIRKQIASAINLILHLARLEDGSRKATFITEVAGMEGDVVTLSDIYRFERTGVAPDGKIQGELRPTRIRPLFAPRLEAAGLRLGAELFGVGGR